MNQIGAYQERYQGRIDAVVETWQRFFQWAWQKRSTTERQRIVGGVVAGVVLITAATLLIDSDNRARAARAINPNELSMASPISDGRNGRAFALVGGKPLFPLPPSSLNGFLNDPVEMQDVRVLSIVDNSGFWIGEDDVQRVFIAMTGEAYSNGSLTPAGLTPGQTVNLSGYLKPLPGNPDAIGVRNVDDVAQLTQQGARVEVNSVRQPSNP